MTTEVQIRGAIKEDIPGILSLYAQPEMDGGEVLSQCQAEKLFNRISRYPNYKIYVAVADNEIVGSFSLLVMDNLAHMGAPSAIVEDVVVTPHRQGQGIGAHMMQFAMDQCKKHGCYKLVLSSNKKRAEAHKFYQKLGFELHGYSFIVKL